MANCALHCIPKRGETWRYGDACPGGARAICLDAAPTRMRTTMFADGRLLLLADSPVCFEKEVRFVACSQRPGAMPIPSVRLGGAQATHGDGEHLAISMKLDSES